MSVAVLDQILRGADRAIAEQAPPNTYVRAAFPVVEHFHNFAGNWMGTIDVKLAAATP